MLRKVYFLLFSLPPLALSAGRKNVLFIGSDDMRPNLNLYSDVTDGVFASPTMHTPNLDKLGERSLVFESAYVQQALCSPSRSSLMTSRRPDTTHVTDLESWFRLIGGNFTTLPQYFKNHGYKSINVGKMFHRGSAASGPGGDDDISWSEKYHAPTSAYYNGNGHSSWEAVSNSHKPLQDTVEADHVIKRLTELAPSALLGEQHFFMGWGLHRPHLPFLFPERFGDFYPERPDSHDLPSNPYVPENMPSLAWSNWAELRAFSDCTADSLGDPHLGEVNVTIPNWKTKDLRRAYYASVSHVDDEIGRVLNVLEELGLSESTVVAFWGDHGWQLGEHAEWCKHTNFEVATHAPLMMAVPGKTDSGLRSSQLVEFVDIFPTIAEAAGLPELDTCPDPSNSSHVCTEGSSLMPLMEDPESSDWKKAVFWQYPRGGKIVDHLKNTMGYSMRTAEWRYTEWVGITYHGHHNYSPDWSTRKGNPELYSMIDDPQENFNVAGELAYAEIVTELSKMLQAGWREALPAF